MAYLIRHLAVNLEGNIVAAAEFKKVIHIWNAQSATKLITLQTNLDFGGRRLAISPDGNFCAVGAYNRYGISLYSVNNGSLLWNRKDLKKVQWLDFNLFDGNVIVGIDEKPLHVLDLMTGNTLETVRGVKAKWISCYDDFYLLKKAASLNLYRNNKLVALLERTSFAVLSVAFSKDKVIVSEAGGPISAYLLTSGDLAWRNYPNVGSHFINLNYNNATSKVYGVLWAYDKGGPRFLCSIDLTSGTVLDKLQLNEQTTEAIFSKRGSYLITSTGDIYNLDEEIPRMIKSLAWDGNDA
jgi:WD40 repeat protein